MGKTELISALSRIRFGAIRVLLFTAFGLLSATPAVCADDNDNLLSPADRVQTRVNDLEDQISNLLLAIPAGNSDQISAPAIEETYRLIIRRLYLSSQEADNDNFRALLVLKADQLTSGLPAFDAFINNKLLPPDAVTSGQTLSALEDFQKAGENIDRHIGNPGDLYGYLDKMLGPLMPLVSDESSAVDPDKIIVWPVQKNVQNNASAAGELPNIDQELLAIQQSNLMPQMRDAIESVLQQLKPGLSNPDTYDQNLAYYRTILQCAELARHLQESSVLSLPIQEQLNHTLLQGLLFFKDPRLRPAAIQRLGSIGLIVHSLELLQQTPLTQDQDDLLSAQVHDLIDGLENPDQAWENSRRLGVIDDLVTQYGILESQPTPSQPDYVLLPWLHCINTGKAVFSAAIGTGNSKDRIIIAEATHNLRTLCANLDRLAAMSQAQQQALLYEPEPAYGVAQNLAICANRIGNAPAEDNLGSAGFDRFQAVLNLLAQTHLDLARKAPDELIRKITSNRYGQFVDQFLQTQHDLINSLAAPQIDPEELIDQLRHQEMVFRATWELSALLGPDKPLDKLNTWGGWQTIAGANGLLLNQFEQALAAEYRKQTGMNSGSDAWMGFNAAAPAIHALFTVSSELSPQLNADPTLWSTSLLRAREAPPWNALFGENLDDFAVVSELLNEAAFNNNQGRDQPAQDLFQNALRRLGTAAQ
jgi:hypothetical protein